MVGNLLPVTQKAVIALRLLHNRAGNRMNAKDDLPIIVPRCGNRPFALGDVRGNRYTSVFNPARLVPQCMYFHDANDVKQGAIAQVKEVMALHDAIAHAQEALFATKIAYG